MKKNQTKLIIFALLIAAFLAVSHLLNLGNKITHAREWIFHFGIWAPLVFGVIYAVLAVMLFPASVMTVVASALFGPVYGLIIVSVSSTAGAALSFLVSRYLARSTVEKWVSENEKFINFDDLVRRNGTIIVGITRLVPLFPYTLLNYAFGLTGIKFWNYVIMSWLFMLPGTVLYVVGTDVIVRIISTHKFPWLAGTVFIVFFFGLIFAVRYARKQLKTEGRQR